MLKKVLVVLAVVAIIGLCVFGYITKSNVIDFSKKNKADTTEVVDSSKVLTDSVEATNNLVK